MKKNTVINKRDFDKCKTKLLAAFKEGVKLAFNKV